MLIQIAFATSVLALSPYQLESYYWDCDTAFMKNQLGGQDLNSCLTITERFVEVAFNNNQTKFLQYWNDNKQQEWLKRGYQSK